VPERFLGQTLGGRYRLTRLLGVGAYAWVYEAVDVELEIPVAVKVLRPEHTGNETAEARFRREATTAARLRHPNIITVRDVGKGEGATWVAMDLVPHTLSRRLQVMPYLPEADVVRLGLDVASALSVAHAEDIIHRDIKPDNILIGASGEAIVCDFGLARALTSGADLSATNQVLGTPHYFSPEQAKGEALDGRSDLYALGVTLYRAATGKLPFEGEEWYAVARQHVDVTPPSPRTHVPAISGAFEKVILRLLAKRPEDRYASATALSDALSRLPSAPATGSRLALTPGGTTTTHTIRGAPWSRARALLLMSFVAIVGIVAIWSAREQSFVQQALARLTGGQPVADSTLDSMVARDTSALLTDSVLAALPIPLGSDTAGQGPASSPPGPRPAARVARLSIGASEDSTLLSINGKRVDFAPWRDDRLPPGRYIVGASLMGGPGVSGCPYSERTDTIMLAAGEQRVHTVRLARCSRVVLEVDQRDAVVSFIDAAGEVVLTGDARSLSQSLIRAGQWHLRGTAPRCADYNAQHTLRPGTDTVRFKMLC
jgi:serine/threonine-protein kinase